MLPKCDGKIFWHFFFSLFHHKYREAEWLSGRVFDFRLRVSSLSLIGGTVLSPCKQDT